MSAVLIRAYIFRSASRLLMMFILTFCFGFQLVSAANSYRQIELKHRNAASVQQSLSPFADENTAIIAQGNSLILKGPAAEINQLVAIVKKLDKPRKQLQVSIYRGIDPSTALPGEEQNNHQDQRWSTDTGKRNRVDIVNIEEGSALIISEHQVLKIPVETAKELGRSDGLNSRRMVSGSQEPNVIEYASDYQRNETLLVEKGVHLTANIVKGSGGQNQVSLATTYSLPDNDKSKVDIVSNRQTSVVTRVDLGKWQLLSVNQQQSQQPSISSKVSSRKQVFSTPQKNDSDYKVWVKFKLL